MDRLSTLAALVVAAIITTVVMFLLALIVWVLGPEAVYFVVFVCIPVECLLLVFDLILIYVSLLTALRFLKLKREEEEERISFIRKRHEIELERQETELEMRKVRLAEYRYQAHKSNIATRRAQLRRRFGAGPKVYDS